MKKFAEQQPVAILLLFVVALLIYSTGRTSLLLEDERRAHAATIQKMKESFWKCQPSVFLDKSNNPIDAAQFIRYRNSDYGHACVFLSDGRYGNLWYSTIVENEHKAHLEWQFEELGKYQW